MKDKKILGMPAIYAICVLAVLVIGIIIGSFADLQINQALENPTKIGKFFATYGSYFSYCLYPAAGMCMYKALIKKSDKNRLLAWVLLVLSYFFAVYYSNSYNGSKVKELFGYDATNPNIWLAICSYLFWVILYSWVPVVFYFILDDVNPNLLLAVGISILVAGIAADCLNLWLKQVGSRPRYKYLLSSGNMDEYRNWWEFRPGFAGSNDNFKSWPSGNMTIACMMFSLPMLTNVVKKHNKIIDLIAFIFAALFVALYGYNRIHMTNHFLTDVCFGTLFTYLVYAVVSYSFIKCLDK